MLHLLPVELVSTISGLWLTVQDLALVDSAYCNKEFRDEITASLYDGHNILQYSTKTKNHLERRYLRDAATSWLISKNVRVKELVCSIGNSSAINNDTIFRNYLQAHGKDIQAITCILCLPVQSLSACIRTLLDDLKTFCQNLKAFHTHGREFAWTVMLLCGKFQQLRQLTISDDDGITYLCSETATLPLLLRKLTILNGRGNLTLEMLRRCPQLKELHACNTVYNDQMVRILAYACPLLTLLHARLDITDTGLTTLITHCPHLQSVDLTGCTYVGKAALSALATKCALRSLILVRAGLTDAKLTAILEMCATLQTLDIRNNPALTNAALLSLAQHCHHMRVLRLPVYRKIDDSSVMAVLRVNPHLTTFELDAAGGIRNCTVSLLLKSCLNLTSLELRNCWVDDGALRALGRHCPYLHTLAVTHKQFVTDTGMKALVKGCRRLETVSIEGCEHVTMVGILALAAHCRGLWTLTVSELMWHSAAALPQERVFPKGCEVRVVGKSGAVVRTYSFWYHPPTCVST